VFVHSRVQMFQCARLPLILIILCAGRRVVADVDTVEGAAGDSDTPEAHSASGLQHGARVPHGLVQVFERPPRAGYVIRARHHHEVTVEALLQDEPGPGNVGAKCYDNDCAPTILRSQTTQLASFALRRRRVWIKAVHGDLGVWGSAEIGQARVIRRVRVRNHQIGSPTLLGQVKAERVSEMVRPAKNEDGVGVAQLIDLWTHIYRHPDCSGEQ
jgi:hypothetical protein